MDWRSLLVEFREVLGLISTAEDLNKKKTWKLISDFCNLSFVRVATTYDHVQQKWFVHREIPLEYIRRSINQLSLIIVSIYI